MKTLRNRLGQGMIEYLMIAAFVVGILIYLAHTLNGPAKSNINSIATTMGQSGN